VRFETTAENEEEYHVAGFCTSSAPGPELAGPPDCAAANRLAAAAKAAVHSYDMMSELFGCRRLQVCALPRILPPFSTLVLYLPL
jgi:hypothetical protein